MTQLVTLQKRPDGGFLSPVRFSGGGKVNAYQKGKEAARAAAQEWQARFGNCSMTWGELAEWQEYFARLGRKYGLLREFAENGII